MTREEAIKWVERIKEKYIHGGDEGFDEARRRALDMAIEALSADTVSREQYDHVCEEYNRLVHKAVCIKLCDENCEYEKGKTCYHAREHSAIEAPTYQNLSKPNKTCEVDLISREDAVNAICKHSCYTEYGLCSNVGFPRTACGYVEAIQLLPSAEDVPQSEQYKKGFEDAKRAFLVEYARERENMRKQNAQLDGWILCSERLPKKEDFVIVTILDEHGDTPYRYTDFGWYLKGANCWIVDAEQRTDVTAWMPLPEPYKEDSE